MDSKCQTSEEKAEVPPMTNATWYGGQALVPSVCLGMKHISCANQSHESWGNPPKRHRQILTNWQDFKAPEGSSRKILKLLLVLRRIPNSFSLMKASSFLGFSSALAMAAMAWQQLWPLRYPTAPAAPWFVGTGRSCSRSHHPSP